MFWKNCVWGAGSCSQGGEEEPGEEDVLLAHWTSHDGPHHDTRGGNITGHYPYGKVEAPY